MLPNGEFNVNSRYARLDLRRDTPQILNLPILIAIIDPTQVWMPIEPTAVTRSLRLIRALTSSSTKQISQNFSIGLAPLTSVNAM
jgi:hypothetical protein